MEKFSGSGVFEWLLSSDFLMCSDNFFNVIGFPDQSTNELSLNEFLEMIKPEHRNYVLDVIQGNLQNFEPFEITFESSHESARKIKLQGYLSGDIQETHLLGLIRDVSNVESLENSLLRGQENERKRISLELHDSVGQKLIATKHMASMFEINKDMSQISNLKKAIDEVISEIRAITHDLSGEVVFKHGFTSALKKLIDVSRANSPMDIDLDIVDGDIDDFPLESQVSIYRIMQEALSNIFKHSNATEVKIVLRKVNKQFIINVIDNGKGFDSQQIFSEKSGIGLKNMRTRVTELNGFLQINSKPKKGANLHIKIPI